MKKLLLISLFLMVSFPAFAGGTFTPDEWADAINRAENSQKYPYGIKSVHCEGEKACRQICINTVKNKHKNWLKEGKKGRFIDYLGSKYAPLSDSPLNANWVNNVSFYLDNPKVSANQR